MRMLHFTATWAAPTCSPHRAEVVAAACALGLPVVEIDVDDPSTHDLVREYEVANIPAMGLEIRGVRAGQVVGALPAASIVAAFEPLLKA